MLVLRYISIRRSFLAIAVTVIALFVTSNATAETIVGENGPSGSYAFGSSNCTGSKSDPVGVLFRGRHAGPTNVSRFISKETGWEWTENDNPQGLLVHQADGSYGCRSTDAANAEHTVYGPFSRFHIRLWYVPGSAGGGEAKTVGTPHHEDWIWNSPFNNCQGATYAGNHAVDKGGVKQNLESGFTRGRHRLKEDFEGTHTVESEYWGNTAEFEQCDGDLAGSDGYGITIWINNSLHPQTADASSVRTTSATLNGTFATEEASEYWFGYGPNHSQGAAGYPYQTAVKTTAGAAEVDISQAISGLTPNVTYYARLFARNQYGEVEEGSETSYTTSAIITPEDDDLGGAHAVAQINGTIDVFYRTPSGGLGHDAYVEGHWGQPELSGSLAPGSVPHPVVQPNGTIDVFYRTPSGGLGHDAYVEGHWGQDVLPGSLASDPHAVAQANGTIDVFYRTPSGGLGHTVYWGGHWSEAPLPGSVSGDPYPVAQANGTIDVFYRTPSGGLGHTVYVEGHWSEAPLPGSVSGEPHPVVQPNGIIDVFYRTPSGGLGHNAYAEGHWGQPELPGVLASTAEPHPVVQPNGTIDVFYRTPSGGLGHTVYWGGHWSEAPLPGSVSGEPYAVVQPNGTIDVFYRTPSGGLGHNAYAEGHWGQPELPGSLDPAEAMGVHALAQPNGTIDVFYRTPSGGLGHNAYAEGHWGQPELPGEIYGGSGRPEATTEAATGIAATTVTLQAKVDPETWATTYQFEYGLTTQYGSKSPIGPETVGSGSSSITVSTAINGLEPDTTYHFRVVASNDKGTSKGEDRTFKTQSAGVASQLAAMPVTELFDGSSASLTNFSSKWATLGWAGGTTPKGEDTISGWRPVNAYSTLNGAYFNTSLTDAGPGLASLATMATNPGGTERYFSVWLDMQSPVSARAGYELRFTNTATNIYVVKLSKWVNGAETVLASQSGYSFVNGNSFAIVDQGATVSAWTDTGSGYSQLLSAADSAFSGGYAGIYGAGNITRLTKFKAGSL